MTIYYTAKEGDTFRKIAETQYGDAKKAENLAKANKLTPSDTIQPGQQIVLPREIQVAPSINNNVRAFPNETELEFYRYQKSYLMQSDRKPKLTQNPKQKIPKGKKRSLHVNPKTVEQQNEKGETTETEHYDRLLEFIEYGPQDNIGWADYWSWGNETVPNLLAEGYYPEYETIENDPVEVDWLRIKESSCQYSYGDRQTAVPVREKFIYLFQRADSKLARFYQMLYIDSNGRYWISKPGNMMPDFSGNWEKKLTLPIYPEPGRDYRYSVLMSDFPLDPERIEQIEQDPTTQQHRLTRVFVTRSQIYRETRKYLDYGEAFLNHPDNCSQTIVNYGTGQSHTRIFLTDYQQELERRVTKVEEIAKEQLDFLSREQNRLQLICTVASALEAYKQTTLYKTAECLERIRNDLNNLWTYMILADDLAAEVLNFIRDQKDPKSLLQEDGEPFLEEKRFFEDYCQTTRDRIDRLTMDAIAWLRTPATQAFQDDYRFAPAHVRREATKTAETINTINPDLFHEQILKTNRLTDCLRLSPYGNDFFFKTHIEESIDGTYNQNFYKAFFTPFRKGFQLTMAIPEPYQDFLEAKQKIRAKVEAKEALDRAKQEWEAEQTRQKEQNKTENIAARKQHNSQHKQHGRETRTYNLQKKAHESEIQKLEKRIKKLEEKLQKAERDILNNKSYDKAKRLADQAALLKQTALSRAALLSKSITQRVMLNGRDRLDWSRLAPMSEAAKTKLIRRLKTGTFTALNKSTPLPWQTMEVDSKKLQTMVIQYIDEVFKEKVEWKNLKEIRKQLQGTTPGGTKFIDLDLKNKEQAYIHFFTDLFENEQLTEELEKKFGHSFDPEEQVATYEQKTARTQQELKSKQRKLEKLKREPPIEPEPGPGKLRRTNQSNLLERNPFEDIEKSYSSTSNYQLSENKPDMASISGSVLRSIGLSIEVVNVLSSLQDASKDNSARNRIVLTGAAIDLAEALGAQRRLEQLCMNSLIKLEQKTVGRLFFAKIAGSAFTIASFVCDGIVAANDLLAAYEHGETGLVAGNSLIVLAGLLGVTGTVTKGYAMAQLGASSLTVVGTASTSGIGGILIVTAMALSFLGYFLIYLFTKTPIDHWLRLGPWGAEADPTGYPWMIKHTSGNNRGPFLTGESIALSNLEKKSFAALPTGYRCSQEVWKQDDSAVLYSYLRIINSFQVECWVQKARRVKQESKNHIVHGTWMPQALFITLTPENMFQLGEDCFLWFNISGQVWLNSFRFRNQERYLFPFDPELIKDGVLLTEKNVLVERGPDKRIRAIRFALFDRKYKDPSLAENQTIINPENLTEPGVIPHHPVENLFDRNRKLNRLKITFHCIKMQTLQNNIGKEQQRFRVPFKLTANGTVWTSKTADNPETESYSPKQKKTDQR